MLRLVRARLVSRSGEPESGFALITVIGVMAVIVIVALAVAGSTMSAVSFTTSTRAGVQAQAAAEGGVDATWVALAGGDFNCASTGSTGTGSFTTATSFFNAAGGPLDCTGSKVSGTPTKAVVRSRGIATPAIGNSGTERTVTSVFDIVVTAAAAASLDKVVFSEGDLTVTNNTSFTKNSLSPVPANLYSNGAVNCVTDMTIEGSVLAQGDFNASAKCQVAGDLWAGGGVSFATEAVIAGDVYSAGGASTPAKSVSMGTAFVKGSVIANGGVTLQDTSNSKACPGGYEARVCGSIVSVEGTVQIVNGARVAGGLYAKGDVSLGHTNTLPQIGGNVVSSTGSLTGTANDGGIRVGGYVAVAGSSIVEKKKIGKPDSSCSTSLVACVPAQPAIPLSVYPAQLNFPTNTRVVAPPRVSLPRIEMYPDSSLAGKWADWSPERIECSKVKDAIKTGWTGKKLVIVDDCTAPISWDGGSIDLRGDLAIMSSAGFRTSNGTKITGASRQLMLIVPSDAKTASKTSLATWSAPIAAQPSYTKPTCASGDYGDIRVDNLTISNVKTFLYTPCDLVFSNQLKGFSGQIYAGTTSFPNGASIEMTEVVVPGVATQPGAVASLSVTQTSRFDARDKP